MRTEDQWWQWHDEDASRWSESTEKAEDRCAKWVAGESDDGPNDTLSEACTLTDDEIKSAIEADREADPNSWGALDELVSEITGGDKFDDLWRNAEFQENIQPDLISSDITRVRHALNWIEMWAKQ